MTEQFLFEQRRVCVCNPSHNATKGKRAPGEPNILALSMTITRKGRGKTMQRAVPSIQICEECLVRALAPSMLGESREAKKMLAGLREKLSASYSALVEADSK